MILTQLVLDLPTSAGVRVVVVDDEATVDACLALVLRRFGAVITSGPAGEPFGILDAATPRARVSEIVAGEGEAFAIVQTLRDPEFEETSGLSPGLHGYAGAGVGRSSTPIGFEMLLTKSTDAVELALSIAERDSLSN